jgi:hypothetical protein
MTQALPQYLVTLGEVCCALPEVYEYTGNVLVSVCHCANGSCPKRQTRRLLVHVTTVFMVFYVCKEMRHDSSIYWCLHLSDKTELGKTDKNYDSLWNYFDNLIDAYPKYYSPVEHLPADEVIVLFRGRVVFKQCIPRKHMQFGTKSYKLCHSKGYTHKMSLYLGKDRKWVTTTMTATHAIATGLTAWT